MRHGFLLINKPVGPSSHDCVYKARRLLHEKKIGHLGTLDPAAEGLMVMAVGAKALKVVELFNKLPKEYEATIRLGEISSTYDREGVIEEFEIKPGVSLPTMIDIQNVISDRIIGKIDQVPPAHSAIKIGGERAYRKMRQGRGVNIPPREVEIKKCEILDFNYPILKLRIGCSSGTYIRSIANDLGVLLRCGGYLQELRRTKVGDWSIDNSTELEDLAWSDITPLKDVLGVRFRIDLTSDQAEDVRHGRDIDIKVEQDAIGWSEGFPIAVLAPAGGKAHARKVL
ncbi:MAG: tRNA pseudouridine(55) synthase TruB [Candidatus Peribacteraceae bacterium]|jgi:tRNA pseudouridine55 synthase|nr:tRNA pseudouridine(55) synthase TruB [Candidatus Peribacteraceae bacterium]MDP7454577.1 tRNA pseudouridine(55) synthase TruB [Candidatus Peribacteraceae bacterium]|tara:strand:- start:437 stop:1288 length:852 start_codon:yes stop_codon:yes gene_type:complete